MKTPGTFLWIYGMPLLLAVLGCVGLAAALFADGLWDWISWLTLGTMTAVGLWHAMRPGAPAESQSTSARPPRRPERDRAARTDPR